MFSKLAFLSVLLLYGCSTTSFKDFFQEEDQVVERNEELLKDFEVKEEVFEKFSVKEDLDVYSDKESRKEQPTPAKKSKATVKKSKAKLAPTKLPKPSNKRNDIRPVPTVVEKEDNQAKEDSLYPANFPPALVKLDKVSEKFWSRHIPIYLEGEEFEIDVSYMGIPTGKINIKTKASTVVGSQAVHHVQVRLKTSDYYSYLYEVNDIGDSFISKSKRLPLKFSLIQRQSSQDIDDLQLFDQDELQTYSFYKRVTENKTKKQKKVQQIPRFYQDPISVLYFIRGLPMEIGNTYHIPVVNQGKIEMLVATVDKLENLDTKIGQQKAYRVKIFSEHKGKTIKGGKMTFWFSADPKRLFLGFDASIKIGKVRGEIYSYKAR